MSGQDRFSAAPSAEYMLYIQTERRAKGSLRSYQCAEMHWPTTAFTDLAYVADKLGCDQRTLTDSTLQVKCGRSRGENEVFLPELKLDKKPKEIKLLQRMSGIGAELPEGGRPSKWGGFGNPTDDQRLRITVPVHNLLQREPLHLIGSVSANGICLQQDSPSQVSYLTPGARMKAYLGTKDNARRERLATKTHAMSNVSQRFLSSTFSISLYSISFPKGPKGQLLRPFLSPEDWPRSLRKANVPLPIKCVSSNMESLPIEALPERFSLFSIDFLVFAPGPDCCERSTGIVPGLLWSR
jgi:hypothetical protein